jgi:hypothetical protein
MIEEGADLLRWLLNQPDPKAANKKLWSDLAKWCRENGYYEGFYIPYVPLQFSDGTQSNDLPVTFKTRYGLVTYGPDDEPELK